MAIKSSRKHKPALPPPTVLTLTLNQNGTGHLIAKRGDLAILNQFTYHDLKDIVAAIQQGAAQLANVEKNPPPKDLPTAPAAATSPEAAATDDVREQPSPEEEEDVPEAANTEEPESAPTVSLVTSTDPAEAVPTVPVDGITTNPPTAQLTLL